MSFKIITADSSGFCFGVRRAIEIAEKTAKREKKLYSLGPLIHNPQEVKRLEKIGIKVVDNPGKLKDSILILRTHGIPQGLKAKLESQNLSLVDATCPFVKRAQVIVQRQAKENKKIVIIGEKNHPEVKALVSYGGRKCFVAQNFSDLKNIDLSGDICVVSQTTQAPENFSKFVKKIKKRNRKIRVFDTICRATIDRQSSAKKLSKKVGLMLIIGGKNSGNTRRLAEICSEFTKTYYIETADELRKSWFKNREIVGIAAGASTPDWIIKEVRKKAEDVLRRSDQTCNSSLK